MTASATRLRPAGAVVFASVVLGCGTGSAFPPSDMSFDAFCPQWQAARQAIQLRCDGVPATASAPDDCARQAASLAAGRLAFDRSLASACVRTWQTMTCETFHLWASPTCDGLETGQAAEGDACSTSDECRSEDDFCDHGASPGCPGVCRARIAAGAACTVNRPGCARGTGCVDPGSGPVCTPGVKVGGDCGPTVGLCFAGLTCSATGNDGGATCQPSRYPGDACGGSAGACVAYATCSSDGRCVRVAVEGEPCGQMADRYADCVDAWCDGVPGGAPGICRAFMPPGAPCSADAQCAGSGATCTSGVCTAPVCPT